MFLKKQSKTNDREKYNTSYQTLIHNPFIGYDKIIFTVEFKILILLQY